MYGLDLCQICLKNPVRRVVTFKRTSCRYSSKALLVILLLHNLRIVVIHFSWSSFSFFYPFNPPAVKKVQKNIHILV